MIDFGKKNSPNILIIGDLIVDKYLWGSCKRISPEAPVQVIDIERESSLLGGAGNVANNLKSLGSNPTIISVVGDCENTKELLDLLERSDLHNNYLIKSKNKIISKKTRLMSSHQHVVRFDHESTNEVDANTRQEIVTIFNRILKEFEVVILSDYGKGLLTKDLCQELISISQTNNIKVIVDPKGTDYSKYKDAFLLTPNIKEASEATGIEITDKNFTEKAIKKLKEDLNLDYSIITLSQDGIALYDKKLKIFPTYSQDVFDVTGAGDTVIASIGFSIALGYGIEDSIEFANFAAGIVVTKVGSSTTNLLEIQKKYLENIKIDPTSRVAISEIELLIEKYKFANKKIIFTNGCFDLIHYGHVQYLQEAKKLGDILIVGINSDKSVRNLKGSSRPINTQDDRANVILGIKGVDHVVVFDEETPKNLIKRISPDVLVKGGDYKKDDVVGKEYSKEVVILKYLVGKSTSQIIKKVIDQN